MWSVPLQKPSFTVSFKWLAKFYISDTSLFCFFWWDEQNEHYLFIYLNNILFTLKENNCSGWAYNPSTLSNSDFDVFQILPFSGHNLKDNKNR